MTRPIVLISQNVTQQNTTEYEKIQPVCTSTTILTNNISRNIKASSLPNLSH